MLVSRCAICRGGISGFFSFSVLFFSPRANYVRAKYGRARAENGTAKSATTFSGRPGERRDPVRRYRGDGPKYGSHVYIHTLAGDSQLNQYRVARAVSVLVAAFVSRNAFRLAPRGNRRRR